MHVTSAGRSVRAAADARCPSSWHPITGLQRKGPSLVCSCSRPEPGNVCGAVAGCEVARQPIADGMCDTPKCLLLQST